jgi:hypothetical protein
LSNRALSWAFDAPLDPGPKFVLVALGDHAADHSGEDWTCFPSLARLTAMTGMSTRTVERHLKDLWRAGWISRVRRRRADGKLGIYDFTLHRDPERRAELAQARGEARAGEDPRESDSEPPVRLTGGEGAEPPVNLTPATRQIGPQPPVNLTGQEPLGEPLEEPSTGRAREPGADGFEAAVALWPDSGRKRTDWRAGRAAWAWACERVEPERLHQAVARCAADPEMAVGDFGWPGLHGWLSGERWRPWLPRPAEEAAPVGVAAWAGPEAVADLVLGRLGAGFAGTLARCGWAASEGSGGRMTAASGWAWDRLKPLAGELAAMGCEVVGPATAKAAAGGGVR